MKSQKAKVPPTFNDVLSTNNGKMTARRDGLILRYPISKLEKSASNIKVNFLKVCILYAINLDKNVFQNQKTQFSNNCVALKKPS